MGSPACHWIRRADAKPPRRRFWSKTIIGRSALGIHTRPTSTAAETGNAGKRLIVASSPCTDFILSNVRLSSWRKRERSPAFRMMSLCGEIAVIDQIETSLPRTATMRSFDTVALKPKIRATLE